MAPIPHDQLFKELLQEFLPEFVALFFPEVARQIDWSEIEFLNPELFLDLPEGARRTLDMVVRVRTIEGDPELLLLHLEVESDPPHEFPARMFEYYCVLRLRRRLPVLPIVVYLKPGHGGITCGAYREQLLGLEVLNFQYHLVAIPDVPRESLSDENPVKHALAPLLGGAAIDRLRLLLAALEGIARTGRDPARQALLAHVAERYVHLDAAEAEELRASLWDNESAEAQTMRTMLNIWERMALERGLEQGREQGLEQGREQGLEQGLAQGVRRSIRKLLEARFGLVPDEVEAALARVTSEERLEDLVVTAGQAGSLEEFVRQLTAA